MSYRIARAAKALLDQANERAPQRDRASDGLVGDVRHATGSPSSWHLPRERSLIATSPTSPVAPDGSCWARDPNGLVLAVDLTHDPAHGIDAHRLARDLVARGEPRVAEVISNGLIWTRRRASEGWRDYSGSNPHTKHVHITIDPRYAEDASPWWPAVASPIPPIVRRKPMWLVQVRGDAAVWITDGLTRRHVQSKAKLAELIRLGVVDGNVAEISLDGLNDMPEVQA